MSITNTQIVDALAEKTIMEVVELISLIEEKFGVSAAAVSASVGPVEAAVVEEQTEFDVVLQGIVEGTNKVIVIKAIRAVTGLGLIESKSLVESTPSVVKAQISKDEANAIKTQLTEAGGIVEIK